LPVILPTLTCRDYFERANGARDRDIAQGVASEIPWKSGFAHQRVGEAICDTRRWQPRCPKLFQVL